MGTAFLRAVRLSLCYLALSLAACEEGPPAPGRGHPDAAKEGAVSFATDMEVARAAHTATRLRGGDTLVAGGFGEGEGAPLASAELYDATAGSFAPIEPLTAPRQSHTATPLPDGRVLITGGVGPGFALLETAELYDPLTGRFSPTGTMSVPRESHTTTLLPDGQVLVAGGHVGREEDLRLYASAELYNPATGRFARADNMTMPRHKHDAVRLSDGRVLIVGGADEREDPRPFDTAEIYDPDTEAFRRTGNLKRARYKLRGTSVLQENGRVVVAGGADGPEVYEPATGEFARLSGSFGRTPLFAAAARVRGGVLLCGGYSREGGPTDAAWLVRP